MYEFLGEFFYLLFVLANVIILLEIDFGKCLFETNFTLELCIIALY